MSGVARGAVLALVVHARQVPAVERERVAALLERGHPDRALTLRTCHRVEGYFTNASEAEGLAKALPAGGRALIGEEAVHHVINVAVGRDSVVVGEDQILHQLRTSVDAARKVGSLDPTLERLFAIALHAGRRARSWRHGPARSLADVALAAIEQQAGPIRGRDILVVGAGRMGRLAVRAAVTAGAEVAVANRSADGAAALAASFGARVEAFDPDRRISGFAGVIVALAGPWPIGAAAIDALAASTSVIVDLSVPSAVPSAIADVLGRRLVTVDALALPDVAPAPENGASARLDALVNRSTAEFLDWLGRHQRRATAEALVEHAERERAAELATLWRRLPALEPAARSAIEEMTRHFAARLLREPLERLGRDSDASTEHAVRDIFAL